MKILLASMIGSFWIVALTAAAAEAQTEGAAAIARETHSRQAEQQIPVLPPRVVAPPVITDALVRERVPPRVADGLVPTRVTDRLAPALATPPPAAVERITAARPVVTSTGGVAWIDAFRTMRYGYYDDGYVDDNWFYDYYELPPAAVAVERPSSAAPGHRTSWRYDPLAEQRMFRW